MDVLIVFLFVAALMVIISLASLREQRRRVSAASGEGGFAPVGDSGSGDCGDGGGCDGGGGDGGGGGN